jgi:AcrR family transcriptional regulator
MKAKTKDRILIAATRLFNETSASEVSTNHIAEAADISPGNLYYHYRNKEAIIRDVLEQMIVAFDTVWILPHKRPVTLADLQQTVQQIFEIHWRFRFFYREQLALLRRDPQLANRHQQIQQQRLGQQTQFFKRFVADGVLQLPPGDTLDDSVFLAHLTAGWIITNHWLSFIEASGETIVPAQKQRGVDLLLRLLAPYLSPAAKQHILWQPPKGHGHDQPDVSP